jgi:hypothetical protein
MTTDDRLDAIHYNIKELQAAMTGEVTRIVKAINNLQDTVYKLIVMVAILLGVVVWPLIARACK